MTDEELQAIRELAENATNSEWFWDSYSQILAEVPVGHPLDCCPENGVNINGKKLAIICYIEGGLAQKGYGDELVENEARSNALFIQEARKGVPALLDEVARLQAELRRWRGCPHCHQDHSENTMCPPHEVRLTGQAWRIDQTRRMAAEVAHLQAENLALAEQKEALASELEQLRNAAHRQAAEVEQTLGLALGYPYWDGEVVLGSEHTPESLAAEAGRRILRAEALQIARQTLERAEHERVEERMTSTPLGDEIDDLRQQLGELMQPTEVQP